MEPTMHKHTVIVLQILMTEITPVSTFLLLKEKVNSTYSVVHPSPPSHVVLIFGF